jgi:hypothetical protein
MFQLISLNITLVFNNLGLTYQFERVDAGEVALGLSLEAVEVEDLGAQPHAALVHNVSS